MLSCDILCASMKSLSILLFLAQLTAPLTGLAQTAPIPPNKPASAAPAAAQAPDPDAYYHLGPDSLPQENVPKGEMRAIKRRLPNGQDTTEFIGQDSFCKFMGRPQRVATTSRRSVGIGQHLYKGHRKMQKLEGLEERVP